jgi:hypothetical protein
VGAFFMATKDQKMSASWASPRRGRIITATARLCAPCREAGSETVSDYELLELLAPFG